MSVSTREVIELTEYRPLLLHRDALPDTLGETLWNEYRSQVEVEFPSPITAQQWRLTAQGWVGYIPLSTDLGISLRPKVSLGNLFRMLEYAYSLKSFRFLDDLFSSDSLSEFYERLANILARRVLDRCRKGVHRTYLSRSEALPMIRGRVHLQQALRSPWRVYVPCNYQEHTADIEDNQIITWTLCHILRSGQCGERALPSVRRAYRSMQGFASLEPYTPQNCVGRLYHRLNEDYHPMHALCRFFLEHSGPTHQMGDRTMLPFLVDMARLYERFVAEWLRLHLDHRYVIKFQERYHLAPHSALHFEIDMVLVDTESGRVRWVMDTKYKTPGTPSTDDIAQVVAYAEAQGCQEAALIYPVPLAHPLDTRIGDIRVRSLRFSLDGDLDVAGHEFIQGLLTC